MQKDVWEKEYRNPKLVTGHDKPQSFFLKFLKDLKKGKIHRILTPMDLEGMKVLDLGCGTGRNSNYLTQKKAKVIGLEISNTALKIAQSRAKEVNLNVDYINHNIGSKYPFGDKSFDLIIDITSSNSLNEKERKIYLSEVNRVLKPDGIFFVRALCKDGDKNAKKPLEKIQPAGVGHPRIEKDTYIMPDTGLQERVFSKDDFIEMYSKYFKILKLEKTESYSTVGDRLYKRKFWLAVLTK